MSWPQWSHILTALLSMAVHLLPIFLGLLAAFYIIYPRGIHISPFTTTPTTSSLFLSHSCSKNPCSDLEPSQHTALWFVAGVNEIWCRGHEYCELSGEFLSWVWKEEENWIVKFSVENHSKLKAFCFSGAKVEKHQRSRMLWMGLER